MSSARAASIRRSSRTERLATLAVLVLLAACRAAPRPAVTPAPPPFTATVQLQHDIEAILATPALEQSYWGIVVRAASTGETLYARNPRRLLMPGSTLKIVTLAAAADRLGWEHAFETRIVAAGTVAASTFEGDVLAIGSGDPSITVTEGAHLFAAVADSLKAQGVSAVTGRVIGDDDVFDDEALGPGWAWDDLAGRDAVAVSGLQYNENVVMGSIAPAGAVGASAIVTVEPAGSDLSVDNQLTTAPDATAATIVARRSPGSKRLELHGSIPIGAAPVVRLFSVDNPTLFFANALRNALMAAGIEVHGPAVDRDDLSRLPAQDGQLLAAHRSAPLSALAVRLMKESQNLYAETLLKAIGATAGTASLEGGREFVAATLQPWGVARTDLVQVDGSGLSRYNYLTAEALVAVLTKLHQDDRLRTPFEASLAIGGRDGTLATRFKGTAAEGNVRAKTGTLANVRSLAGFVTNANGETLAFAILANNYGFMPEVAIAAIDEIVVKLAEFKR